MVKQRFVQTFKITMMKSEMSGEKIKSALSNFLARYRVTLHCTTGIAPCELLMKSHLITTKLGLIQPIAKDIVRNKSKSGLEVVERSRGRVDSR